MRRELRGKKYENKSPLNDKIITYSIIGVTALTIMALVLVIYSRKLSNNIKNSTLSLGEMTNSITDNNTQDTESASTEIGKSVEEAQNGIDANVNTNNSIDTNMTTNTTSNTTKVNNATNTNTTVNTIDKKTTVSKTNDANKKQSEEKKELSFQKPVDGNVIREYAKDNLIYSNTLKEWVTHMGIDIKADKTTVVKAAENGVIKSIKNDPRYGLTIVIDHGDNFQTIYSNLLTSEFVVEGEKVEKGQSIGTVGNTAAFEIADEPHLHFEILKDSVPVDPSIYIK